MINTKKLIAYICLFIFALLFFSIDHRGVLFGDYLFSLGGIPTRSDGDHGLNFIFILGIILIYASSKLLGKQLKLKYKKVGRKMLLFGIAFLLCFPLLSRTVMFVANANQSGLNVLDYSKKDLKCTYESVEELFSAQCTVKLFNYGNEDEVVLIKPIIENSFRFDEFSKNPWESVEYKEVTIPARSSETYLIVFDSKPTNFSGSGSGGTTSIDGISFMKDEKEKSLVW